MTKAVESDSNDFAAKPLRLHSMAGEVMADEATFPPSDSFRKKGAAEQRLDIRHEELSALLAGFV